MQTNGVYIAILDNLAVHIWHIFAEVEPGIFRNVATKRGTYFEANSLGWWVSKERKFRSYFLTVGEFQ